MRARAKVVHATVPDPKPMIEHFETHLRRAIRRAAAHADRVVVVRQSWFDKDKYTTEELAHFWHGGAGQAWREEVAAYYSVEVTSGLMALVSESASHIANELGVERIDLMDVLEPTLETYYDFFHLTPKGARQVADALARLLVREDRVTTVARAVTTVGRAIPRCAGLRAS